MGNSNSIESYLKQGYEQLQAVIDNIERVIIGKRDAIRYTLVAVLSGGHVLLEDVPGVGKTMLVRALARSLGCTFGRIQFTPDLLPSDVTGVSIYNQKSMEFEFRPGPIMANMVLADEINRTSPKTQAALLEALEENSVTVDGTTHILEAPFFVIATQNPIEYEGTYPLPEAELDRFMLRLHLGYPSSKDEVEFLTRVQKRHPIEDIKEVLSKEELLQLQEAVREVYMEEEIKKYIVMLVQETRTSPHLYLGASPRGSLALFRAAQAHAFISGRSFVIPDDVKKMAPLTLPHRLLLTSEARLSGMTTEGLVREILRTVPAPVSLGEG